MARSDSPHRRVETPGRRATEVRTLNIDGDGQGDLGGHGGPHRAVLVYQRASYEYWRVELGRDNLEYGQFGENFTVEGLSDDEVCIGDQYEIGQALFEVSQPRVTCYRVGMRLGEPGCLPCWSATGVRGSICAYSGRASFAPVTPLSRWPPDPVG